MHSGATMKQGTWKWVFKAIFPLIWYPLNVFIHWGFWNSLITRHNLYCFNKLQYILNLTLNISRLTFSPNSTLRNIPQIVLLVTPMSQIKPRNTSSQDELIRQNCWNHIQAVCMTDLFAHLAHCATFKKLYQVVQFILSNRGQAYQPCALFKCSAWWMLIEKICNCVSKS